MRTLFAAAACALAVTALAACGGGSSHPSNQTIRGGGFRFLAPYSWHKQEREGSVEVSPKPVSPELVSVSVFPLLHPYKPALFAAVTRELDTDARQLATRLGGTVKPGWPILTNIRLDPFERTGLTGSINFYSWYAYEFWRFVYVQQEVARFGETFVEFPPMQKGASFSLEAVKQQILEASKAAHPAH